MRTTSVLTGAAALALLLPNVAAAQADTLSAVAAMSKLEANVAEAAAALFLATTPGLPEEARGDAIEEFAEDSEQITFYVAQLQAMELTEPQAQAVAAFAEGWTSAEAQGQELLAAPVGNEGYQEQLVAWWSNVEELDEAVDAQLEAILSDAGVPLHTN